MLLVVLIIVAIVIIISICFLITAITGAPYVATDRKAFAAALGKIYPLKSSDYVIDLGSGNGVILDICARKGARTLGLELNPILATISKWHYRKNTRIKIKCRNFYRFKFPKETTIVYAYALGNHILPIYRKIQTESNRLDKTIFLISNAFNLTDIKAAKHYKDFYLYKITPKHEKAPA